MSSPIQIALQLLQLRPIYVLVKDQSVLDLLRDHGRLPVVEHLRLREQGIQYKSIIKVTR